MRTFWSNRWYLSISAGILLGLSFPPLPFPFLSFPAFILIFRVIDLCDGFRQTAYYMYPGLVIWNLITTYWLMMADVWAGIAAILANSVVMTLPLGLAWYFGTKLRKKWLIALLQASSWVAYEFFHHNWDLSWPWLAIGNAWADMISLIQYISITGHLGISFWVILTSALLYHGMKDRSRPYLLSGMSVFLIFPLFSLIIFLNRSADTPESVTPVTVVQPNHDSYLNYGGMSGVREVMDSLFVETDRHRTSETELVVWPENAIDKAIYASGPEVQRMEDSARAWNADIITGTGYLKFYDENEEVPAYHRLNRDYEAFNVYNTAVFVSRDRNSEAYFKANLVPIVERVPFLPTLIALDVFDLVPWSSIPSFGKGTEQTLFTSGSYATTGLVCYDSVYPGWIKGFVQQGATFLTIITNDGWWGDTSGHHQHFAYARLRAIEFDRWVVRSANNGISGIISPDGRIQVKTGYWERTGFRYDVPNKTSTTLYTRLGNWLPWSCALAVSAYFILLLVRERLS